MGASGAALADAGAHGATVESGGLISGNVVQVPVPIPICLGGNTVNIIGLLNPAIGNRCTIKG